jgi:hypothetical protein
LLLSFLHIAFRSEFGRDTASAVLTVLCPSLAVNGGIKATGCPSFLTGLCTVLHV